MGTVFFICKHCMSIRNIRLQVGFYLGRVKLSKVGKGIFKNSLTNLEDSIILILTKR
jgi:hypothetical protein